MFLVRISLFYLASILLSGDTGPIDTITYVQYPYSYPAEASSTSSHRSGLGRWPLPPVAARATTIQA